MTYSLPKSVHAIIDDDMSFSDELEDIINTLEDKGQAEIGNHRYIHETIIDDILKEELESDAYILGCFNASFIASVTDWPLALIEAGQKGDEYDSIGQALIDDGHVAELAKAYASADGYGHHFAHYDGNEDMLDGGWYRFRIN